EVPVGPSVSHEESLLLGIDVQREGGRLSVPLVELEDDAIVKGARVLALVPVVREVVGGAIRVLGALVRVDVALPLGPVAEVPAVGGIVRQQEYRTGLGSEARDL